MNSDHWYTGRQPTRTPTLNHSEFLAGLHAPDWMTQGICAQADPEAWFPEKGGSTREAKSVCLTCDVRAECLEYALERQERFGIWGGALGARAPQADTRAEC